MLSTLFAPLLIGVYASRVANRLIDLGVDPQKVGDVCGRTLYELERDRRKEFSPHETAAYFVVACLPDLPQQCLINDPDRQEFAARAGKIIADWAYEKKMRMDFTLALMRNFPVPH